MNSFVIILIQRILQMLYCIIYCILIYCIIKPCKLSLHFFPHLPCFDLSTCAVIQLRSSSRSVKIPHVSGL